MTTYFDTREGWLRDLRALADGHTVWIEARCAKTLRADAQSPDVDFFFRGIAHAWMAAPCESVALSIVQAIEREVRRDVRAVGLASDKTVAGCKAACEAWESKHPPCADDYEDLDVAAERVRALCSDAHDLMHGLANVASDNPVTAFFILKDRKL
jgi:hypothetical protein